MGNQDVLVPAGYVVLINKAVSKPGACRVDYLSAPFFFSPPDLQSHCPGKSMGPGGRTEDSTVHEQRAITHHPDGTKKYRPHPRLPPSSFLFWDEADITSKSRLDLYP